MHFLLQQFMQILKQCLSFFRFRRQVCRSPPQPEADLLNVILEISGESISSECYMGLFRGNPFLLNVILDYSGETVSTECYLGPFWAIHFY